MAAKPSIGDEQGCSCLSVVFDNPTVFSTKLTHRDPELFDVLKERLHMSNETLGKSAIRCTEKKREQALGKVIRTLFKAAGPEGSGAAVKILIAHILEPKKGGT